MKRMFIIFGLLVCFALPAQIASAYSFNSSLSLADNLNGLVAEHGGRVINYSTSIIGQYDLLQLSGPAGSNILDSGYAAEGFRIVQDVDTDSFKLLDPYTGEVALQSAITEAYMIKGTGSAVYEYNGQALPIYNGAVIFTVSTAAGNFTMMAISTGFYSPSSVPVPAAVWLMGTGIAGLVALRRRNG